MERFDLKIISGLEKCFGDQKIEDKKEAEEEIIKGFLR